MKERAVLKCAVMIPFDVVVDNPTLAELVDRIEEATGYLAEVVMFDDDKITKRSSMPRLTK